MNRAFSARKRVVLSAVALIVACLAASAAAVLAASPSPSATEKLVLRIGWTIDVTSLNPFIGYDDPDYEFWALNYDMLTRLDPATLEPKPDLAESWETSPDGKTWTFNLRHDVTWQDGQPFTADDVAFTFNYIIDNDMSNFTGYTTFVESVEAVDDYTVQFVCSKPKANMLSLVIPILPEHIWASVDPDDAGTTYRNSPPVIGTGAFQVVEWKKDRYIRLVANPDYWRGAAKIDEVIFQLYENPDAMVQDLRAGRLQGVIEPPVAAFLQLQQEGKFGTAHADVVRAVHNVGFNCYTGKGSKGHPAMRDPAFRRALQWAIDRDKIATVAYGGLAKPAQTYLVKDYYQNPDYHWEPSDDVKYTYDPEKAATLLDEAGYADTNGDGLREYKGKPMKLRLWAVNRPPERVAASRMIAKWFEDVGLDIQFEAMDEGPLTDKQYAFDGDEYVPDYDMFTWGWDGDHDPNFLLSVFTTDQIADWSDTQWSNAQFDQLFEEQQSTLDAEQRKEIVWQMQQIMYEDTPAIFFCYPEHLRAWDQANWEGWVPSPAGYGLPFGTWNNANIDSYLQVQPKVAAEATAESTDWWIPVLVVVVAAAAAVAVWLLVRRRPRKVDEA